MTQVTFYQLAEDQSANHAELDKACELATTSYRARQRCLVLCADQQQAQAFDELLWQRPTDAFVPHNLTGEGPNGGAPVEITWPASQASSGRGVLINLTDAMPENGPRFAEIHEFAPADETRKQQARERFKQYRLAGINPAFVPLSTPASSNHETNDG